MKTKLGGDAFPEEEKNARQEKEMFPMDTYI